METSGRGTAMCAVDFTMQPTFDLMPVRDYTNIRRDALQPFLRAAASGSDGLLQRANEFREHAVRVLGPETFEQPRDKLLASLVDEAERWGRQFHAHPEKIVQFVENNPVVLGLPLGRLMNVPAVPRTLYGILADAIDSIVVRMVLVSSPEEVQEAVQKSASTKTAYGWQALLPIEFGKLQKWPFPQLKGLTFNYLDKAIENWGRANIVSSLTGDSLHSYLISNSPRTDKLPVKEKLEIIKKSPELILSKISRISGRMSATKNTVGDVVSAALDSAILENATKWVENVGKSIDWGERFKDDPSRQQEKATDEEGETGLMATREAPTVTREAPTTYRRRDVETKVLPE